MRIIVERQIEIAKAWLSQKDIEISEEERKMWNRAIKDCNKILVEKYGVKKNELEEKKDES